MLAVGGEALQWTELLRSAPPSAFDKDRLARDLAGACGERLKEGQRVGIAVGSRGIDRLAEVVTLVAEAVRAAGASPVVIPAMGSHGGATASGQVGVLEQLGISGPAVGAPVEASMDAVKVGTTPSGQDVYVAASALGCDVVVPVNRVKPHTDFRGDIESGLIKMLTIGLGKEVGASSLHSAGFASFHTVLPEAARLVLSSLEVPLGVALIEDAWHRLHRGEVVPGEALFERDAAMLKEAWDLFGTLPFEDLDVLLLKEMGKTVSGAGMDPNVTGRFPNDPLPARTTISRLVVLDLRDDSGGNAIGVGVADVVTERLQRKVNWDYTYANALASKSLPGVRLPLVSPTDQEAISVALGSLVGDALQGPRCVGMVNTLDVNHFVATAELSPEAQAAGFEVVAEGLSASFSPDGRLDRIGGIEFFPRPAA